VPRLREAGAIVMGTNVIPGMGLSHIGDELENPPPIWRSTAGTRGTSRECRCGRVPAAHRQQPGRTPDPWAAGCTASPRSGDPPGPDSGRPGPPRQPGPPDRPDPAAADTVVPALNPDPALSKAGVQCRKEQPCGSLIRPSPVPTSGRWGAA
jgi:hypothetical protein